MPAIIRFLGYEPTPTTECLIGTIVRFRKSQGWTQPELSRRLGVHPSTVGHWECGLHGLNEEYRRRVEKLLRNGG